MPIIYSPLRYPGGKSQLAPQVIDLIKVNELNSGVYVEPFAGGAGIAWKLLLDGHMSEVWINDFDKSVYSFWASVLRHTDDFCEKIESTSVTIDEWHRQRAVQEDKRSKQIDLGFSTFFLNRTNRSGIIKAGVIGGLSQQGNYELDCRFNKKDLLNKIRRIALYKEQIKLFRMDAEVFLTEQIPKLPPIALINIDPPYFHRGPELYSSYYKPQDHQRLAKVIKRIRHNWIMTYDNAPEIAELYQDCRIEMCSLNYSAQTKKKGVELLIYGPTIQPVIQRAVA
jgi:DNA adenine methylase